MTICRSKTSSGGSSVLSSGKRGGSRADHRRSARGRASRRPAAGIEAPGADATTNLRGCRRRHEGPQSRLVAFMSSSRRVGRWSVPRDLRMFAMMSDSRLDLTSASLPVGGVVNIEAHPRSWRRCASSCRRRCVSSASCTRSSPTSAARPTSSARRALGSRRSSGFAGRR